MLDYKKREAHILKANKKLVDELLELNINNRNVRKAHLEWIKKSIEDDKFILTGQGVCVSKEGVLIDGQHRLLAIKDAGYPPVEILVVTGLDDESKIYVDQHAKRSITDMLKIVMNQNINNKMAATITTRLKLGYNEENCFVFRKGSMQRVPLSDVINEMEKYSYHLSMILSAAGNLPRAGVLAAYLDYAIMSDLDDVVHLAEQVKNGERLLKDDPAYRLRAFLLGGTKRTSYGSVGQLEDYKNTVTACIAHATGEKLTSLRPSQNWEKLPRKQKPKVVKKAA